MSLGGFGLDTVKSKDICSKIQVKSLIEKLEFERGKSPVVKVLILVVAPHFMYKNTI